MHYTTPEGAQVDFIYSAEELARARVFNPKDKGLCILWENSIKNNNDVLFNDNSLYPVYVDNIKVLNAEVLYHIMKFPAVPRFQEKLLEQTSTESVRELVKENHGKMTIEWDADRVDVMRWVLRVKLAQNYKEMGAALASSKKKVLVKRSLTDDFWGVILMHGEKDVLVGRNIFGFLLKEVYHELIFYSRRQIMQVVVPPTTLRLHFLGNRIHHISRADKLTWRRREKAARQKELTSG